VSLLNYTKIGMCLHTDFSAKKNQGQKPRKFLAYWLTQSLDIWARI